MQKLTKIPRLRLDNYAIMRNVDGCRDLVGYPSILNGIDYATDGTDLLILSTTGGYLRMNAKLLKTFITELQWLEDDIERRSRD